MKRSWTALAVAVVTIFAVVGCNDYGNTFQGNTGALLSFLSPSQISAGTSDFTLTLNGSGFLLKTVVQWNGKTLVTTVPVDSTGAPLGNIITAAVPAALVAKPGIVTVNTLSPASGAGQNGLSNPVAFVINPPPNPLPGLTSIAPQTKTPGSPDFTLTLSGSNFLPASDPSGGSQVKWSGAQQRQLTIVGTTTQNQITATVTSDLLVNTSTSSVAVSVTVFNPPSPPPTGCTVACTGGGGGGSSTPQTFTICGAGQTSCAPLAVAKSAETESVAEETPALSLDGRYVAYTAVQNERSQIFLRDTCEGASASCQPHTTLLSATADGTSANGESHTPSMSSDGRYVAFSSTATNLVDNAPPGRQVYLLDTCAGAGDSCKPSTYLISVDPSGALVGTESILPSVSSSGRFVAFLAITPSHSSNQASASSKTFASGDNSGYRQVFIRDTCLGVTNCTPKTTRISLQPGEGTASGSKSAGPALSGNARQIAISGANAATLFTRSVAVDDRVFLAITNQHP